VDSYFFLGYIAVLTAAAVGRLYPGQREWSTWGRRETGCNHGLLGRGGKLRKRQWTTTIYPPAALYWLQPVGKTHDF